MVTVDRRQLELPVVLPHHGMLPGRACKIIVRIFGVRLAENVSTCSATASRYGDA
jgi:hypothetical protein